MVKKLEKILKEYGQEHVLKFFNELNEEQKNSLIDQIESLNLKEINKLYENSKKDEDLTNRFSPIDYIDKKDLTIDEIELYKKIGENCIKNNEIAIVTMAGGQGSRLGLEIPKGTYELKINNKNKSLFEFIFDNIKKVKEKYNIEPFWLIMTSIDNNKKVKEYFEKENYFGYNKDKIIFFKQSNTPILDINGKLVLENKYHIKEASNGNGDVFDSMKRNNIISKLKENNIKYLSFMRNR